jgi:hypothetical protein
MLVDGTGVDNVIVWHFTSMADGQVWFDLLDAHYFAVRDIGIEWIKIWKC